MEKCRYDGHNSQTKTAAIVRPDGKEYKVPYLDEKNILEYLRPIEEALTKRYHREKALDKIFNIKRDLSSNINGFIFCYDIKDNIVEVYDILTGYHSCSEYNNIKELFNLEDEKTYTKIINKIQEDSKVEIEEIKYLKWKYNKSDVPYKEIE